MSATRLAIAVVVVGFTASSVRADVDVDAMAAGEARRHFSRGSAFFKLEQYESALTEFRAAYSFSRAPGLLFNMGQAARAGRRFDVATYYYRSYLEAVPDAPERPYIEERLREMPLVTVPLAERGQTPDARPDDGRGLRIAGIATLVAGAGLGATAVIFAVRASSAAHDVTSAFEDGGTYGPALEERYADGRRDRTIAIVTGVGAAALVAGGSTMWILGARRRAASVAVDLAAGGMTVQSSWAF